MKELYFSLDIETDGPIPGPHSMLSLGLAAFEAGNETPLETTSANLELLPGATMAEDTARFWEQNKEAYEETRKNTLPPELAMKSVTTWIGMLTQVHHARAVCVAYPATFDFMFFYWYLVKFCGHSPFGFQALDMKSLAMGHLITWFPNMTFKESTKRNYPQHWFSEEKRHTHVALDDAIEQGIMFIRMLRDIQEVKKELISP